VLARELVEPADQGGPLRAGQRRHLGDHERRGEAVLVAHHLGQHAVADRLLVAEGDPRRAGDPLEARQRGRRLEPGRARDTAQPAAGDDGVRESCRCRPWRRSRWSPSSTPSSSPVSIRHSPRCGSSDRGGAAVGVGVVGDHHVGLDGAGELEGEVDRAGLLRVREGDGGEVRVGIGLLRDRVDLREAGAVQGRERGLGAHAVHRGVHDPHLPRPGEVRQGADRVEIVLAQLLAQQLPALARPRDLPHGADGRDARGDLRVRGRHDLHALPRGLRGAAAEVDLVAVVGRRVVGGGDDDPRVRLEVAHGEGDQRRGAGALQQAHPAAGRGHDLGGGAGEVLRAVPGVEADHHQGLLEAEIAGEMVGEAPGGAGDDGEVHPRRARRHPAAQPGRAELELPGEGVAQLLERGLGARLGLLEQARQGRAGGQGRGRRRSRPRPVRAARRPAARGRRDRRARGSCLAAVGRLGARRSIRRAAVSRPR
jgi:hypothetical protein